jgi:hypothetical protein
METDLRVSELLLRWQELRREGQVVTAAELCADCPELAGELQRRMETVDHWEQFLGATTDEEDTPEPGPASFGKYQVVRELDSGGQASTLLALDPDLHCHVVLKLYHRARAPAEQELVLREGQALARVRSPYVARCLGIERQDGVPALVVEYVPGRDLKAQQRARPLGIAEALELAGQLAEGLAAVHASGRLHRDLKPSNVVVGDDGRPRLVDFGLAVPVGSADGAGVSGTLAYMAPEQARGEAERIDPRTDVYGLGAVLYELLTGRPPRQGATPEELWRAACAGDVVPPRQLNRRVSRAVNDLCLRCLAKDPTRRFASAAELAAAIRRLQRWRWLQLLAAALLLAGAVAVAVLAGITAWLLFAQKAPPAQYRGQVDVLVERGDRLLRLNEAGALPLHKGDKFRVEGRVDPPAYLYVVWVDPGHDVTPVYPWDAEKGWGSRPAEEEPVGRVSLPPNAGLRYTAEDARPGVATMVLFARPTPLDVPDLVLKGWFEGLHDLPLPRGGEQAAVWFDNYVEVRDWERVRTFGTVGSDDAFARWQGQLQQVLGGKAAFQTAVSFARTGGK